MCADPFPPPAACPRPVPMSQFSFSLSSLLALHADRVGIPGHLRLLRHTNKASDGLPSPTAPTVAICRGVYPGVCFQPSGVCFQPSAAGLSRCWAISPETASWLALLRLHEVSPPLRAGRGLGRGRDKRRMRKQVVGACRVPPGVPPVGKPLGGNLTPSFPEEPLRRQQEGHAGQFWGLLH